MPNYGDRREIGTCKLCGGPEYAVFSSRSVYHNDTEDYWDHQRHEFRRGDHTLCLAHLVSRIRELEKKQQ